VSASEPLPAPAPRSSRKTAVIAVIVVILTFVSGAAAGFLLAHLRMLRRHDGRLPHLMPAMMVHHLDRALDLTPEQRVKVEEIVRRHHQRIESLMESTRPQVRQELDAANREIEALLTPEQRQKFAAMRLRLGHREGRSRTAPTR
jgi:Spy/CpxP family protein refolding chaperone